MTFCDVINLVGTTANHCDSDRRTDTHSDRKTDGQTDTDDNICGLPVAVKNEIRFNGE